MDFKTSNRINKFSAFLRITFVILLCICANIFSEKYFYKKNINKQNYSSLSNITTKFIDQNKQNINVFIILDANPENNVSNEIVQRDMTELFRKYRTIDHNNLINIEFIHPVTNKKQYDALSTKFGIIPTNTVLIASNYSNKVIPITDMYNIVNGEIISFRGELVTTSSMMSITNTSQFVIYFLTGHKELDIYGTNPNFGLSSVANFLKNKNYSVRTLDLTDIASVPEDANLLVIAGPQNELLSSEVTAIKKFLAINGGSVMFAKNPFEHEGLDRLLTEWGINIENELIACSTTCNLNINDNLLLKIFAPHITTQSLINFRTPIVFGKTSSLSVSPEISTDNRFQITQLIISNESPVNTSANDQSNIEYCVAMLSEKTLENNQSIHLKSGKLFVTSNDTWLSNSKFNLLGNRMFLNDVVSYLIDDDYNLDISSMTIKNHQLTMSRQDFIKLFYKLGSIPLIFLILGSVVLILNKK